MIQFHNLSQSADFRPRSAARSVAASSSDAAAGRSNSSSCGSVEALRHAASRNVPGGATSGSAGVAPGPQDSISAAAGRQKQSSNILTRLLMAARSALESRKFAQSLFDIFALLFWAAFGALLGCAVLASFVILFFVGV